MSSAQRLADLGVRQPGAFWQRVVEMCSLRVEFLSQDGGYDSLKVSMKRPRKTTAIQPPSAKIHRNFSAVRPARAAVMGTSGAVLRDGTTVVADLLAGFG